MRWKRGRENPGESAHQLEPHVQSQLQRAGVRLSARLRLVVAPSAICRCALPSRFQHPKRHITLRVRARKNHPNFGIGTMVAFVRTCSYGGRTWTTVAIRGDRPSAVVVRCPSVAVGLSNRRRQLATGVQPAFAPRRGLYSQCYCMTPQRQKSKQIHLPSQSCLPLGSHAIALAP